MDMSLDFPQSLLFYDFYRAIKILSMVRLKDYGSSRFCNLVELFQKWSLHQSMFSLPVFICPRIREKYIGLRNFFSSKNTINMFSEIFEYDKVITPSVLRTPPSTKEAFLFPLIEGDTCEAGGGAKDSRIL